MLIVFLKGMAKDRVSSEQAKRKSKSLRISSMKCWKVLRCFAGRWTCKGNRKTGSYGDSCPFLCRQGKQELNGKPLREQFSKR